MGFSVPNEKRIFLCAYAILFGVLVVLFEFLSRCTMREVHQKRSFGFLFTGAGRALFFGFLGLLCVGLGLWGVFVGGLWFLYAFVNYFIISQASSSIQPSEHIYELSDFKATKK